MKSKKIPVDYGLRVGVKGNGCAGVTFLLGFDKSAHEDDRFDISGIEVYIAKKDAMYLMGLEIDYYEGADTKGFTIVNSQAETNL